jgi:hypothetical protein
LLLVSPATLWYEYADLALEDTLHFERFKQWTRGITWRSDAVFA